ncbi:MAG: creatininase family protein [Chloroflexi bacterium]|nr:creatininase family protein [Chloroflexota bacterium]
MPGRVLQEITQPEAAALLDRSGLVVIPCGSIEQHGPHLPFGTDTYAAESVAVRLADELDALVATIGPLGVTPFHMSFAGTVTVRPTTFVALLEDVCDSLIRHGARRFVFVNWHEGNQSAIGQAAASLQVQHAGQGVRFVVVQAMWIAHELFGQEVGLTHGGEIEALAVLADHPELAHLERATNPGPSGPAAELDGLRRRKGAYPILADIREITPTGWYGTVAGATPDRAKEMAEQTAARAAAYVREAFTVIERAAEWAHPAGSMGVHGAARP